MSLKDDRRSACLLLERAADCACRSCRRAVVNQKRSALWYSIAVMSSVVLLSTSVQIPADAGRGQRSEREQR